MHTKETDKKNALKKLMSKKAYKKLMKSHRATNGMNTGTRDMGTDKHPTRARQRELDRIEMM